MRNNIVAGNWKMNNDATQTTALINDLNKALEEASIKCRVLISPTSINLTSAVALTKDSVIEVQLRICTKLKMELSLERFLQLC